MQLSAVLRIALTGFSAPVLCGCKSGLCVECHTMRASISLPGLKHSVSMDSVSSASPSTPSKTPKAEAKPSPAEKQLVYKFDLPTSAYLQQPAIPSQAEVQPKAWRVMTQTTL